jgi:heme/copper-type cytochrome/quinol oxidase subunit 1
MFLLEWTASDLLMMALGAITMTGLVLWLVPGAQVSRKRAYSQAELTAYDHQIPRYFLAAALALIIGGLHTVVKSVPGFWQWLWAAGYGGHLFRDLSNSHIIIVGGGTVLLTGITWYVLPRFTNRPLYSTALASASFWFTLVGVFGFYLAWLVLGLVEGNMIQHGWDYMAAKEAIGAWHRVPTRITASIMGVGYWTYVLNVLLTVWAARHVIHKPLNYLTKFAVVSALALFVGTVQGVIQVLPANADWIHLAGKFGQYVDPISHAHINLVTGMMVSLAAFLVYFGPRLGGTRLGQRPANRLFWILVPGSLAFYLAFLLLGLILGGAANGYGGIQIPRLVPLLARWRATILAISGSLMLAGFWVYFITLWRSLHLRSLWQQVQAATPAAFWLISSLALLVGTCQGLLQVIPATAYFLTTPEEVPNIHAQLNMIGGVLLALIGLVYLLLPELVGQTVERRLARLSLAGIGGGIGGYYLVTLATGLLRLTFIRSGMNDGQAAARLGWVAPAALLLTAIPMLVGYIAFGVAVFRATRAYRAELRAELRQAPARFSGPMPDRLKQIPIGYVLGMEFAGGLFGWPGLGWLYAGQAMPAVALLLIGPSIAWALLPALFSPFTNTILSQWNWLVLLVWLPGSAILSSLLLAAYLRRSRRPSSPRQVDAQTTTQRPPSHNGLAGANVKQTRTPRVLILGAALMLLALLSVPLVPLFSGIPGDTSQLPLMNALPDRASGAYLEMSDGQQSGLLKLYPWSFPLEEIPDETPVLNPAHVQSLFISQKGLDDPGRYMLFQLHDEEDHQIPLWAQTVAFQRQLRLIPAVPLEAGNYMLNIPTGGMFAGRDYYYFRIDPTITVLPPVAPSLTAAEATAVSEPGRWLEIFPVSATLISAAFALLIARRLRRKIRPHEAAWGVAFTLFALAAGSQVMGDLWNWTPTLVRLYYVSGATLVVGWLGLGTWLLLVHKPWLRQAGLWVILLATGYSLGLVSLAPVDTAHLATEGWHALDKPLPLTVLTIGLNGIGTLVLVGGALWSAWLFWREGIMRERMVGCILLATGALMVAAGGSLTRLGQPQYLYIAMSVGVAFMFWGYLKTIRPAKTTTGALSAPSVQVHVGTNDANSFIKA